MTPHPRSLADAVGWTKQGRGTVAVLLDEFLDAFYAERDAPPRQAMIDDEPVALHQTREDACCRAPCPATGARHPALLAGPMAEPGRPLVRRRDGSWFVGVAAG